MNIENQPSNELPKKSEVNRQSNEGGESAGQTEKTKERISELEEQLREKEEEIAEKDQRITELEGLVERSRVDPLTGVSNRSGLQEEIELRFKDRLAGQKEGKERRAKPEGPVNVVFIDLNRFKPINDRYGHAAGDQLLQKVAENLRSSLRSSDVVARVGGDEFLVAFVGNQKVRETVRDKVERVIQNTDIEIDGEKISAEASVGVATHQGDESMEEVIKRADAQMYDEKQKEGKNR